MIYKFIVINDKILKSQKFSINLKDNNIEIKIIETKNNIIKIPIYNKYNGLNYVPIQFPLNLPIINNYLFNPYIILSSFNLKTSNDLDFFYNLEKIIKLNFNLDFLDFNILLEDKYENINFIDIYNKLYLLNINFEMDENNIDIFIKSLYFNINIMKLGLIYILIKYSNITNKQFKIILKKNNIPSKLISLANSIKNFKYNLYLNNLNYSITFSDYYNNNINNPLKINEIKESCHYYIIINDNDMNTDIISTTQTINNNINIIKIIKIFIKKIRKNKIFITNDKCLLFDNYKWHLIHPNFKINKDTIIFQTFNDINFNNNIIKCIFDIDDINANKIIEYYNDDNKLSNLILLGNIYDKVKHVFDDFSILKSMSFSDGYFEYITKKYSSNDKVFEILEILFNNYNYPLKTNRHDLDHVFDYILYISLYNYKKIFITNNNLESLNIIINNIIPNKLKNLYINLLKNINQIINNNYDLITYNKKFYNDYLYRNIIKIFFSNSKKLVITLFKSLINQTIYDKFKNIVYTNILLTDISTKIKWSNIPKKLNYLNYFYKNIDFIYYQSKINKNIIHNNIDFKIIKIIINPFEMYKYLRKEKDFIKWTKFISDKIFELYYTPISVSSEDFIHIGTIIYLLFNIKEQNINDESYISFIKYCNQYNKLIIHLNRINLKIKEKFKNLKININLGLLTKHIIDINIDNSNYSFIEPNNLYQKEKDITIFEDNINIEHKLNIITKKYNKYKSKYYQSKTTNNNIKIEK